MALVVWCLLPEHKTPITTLPCADIVSGCGNQNIQIHFDQIPQAMQPFRLQIDTANALRVKQVHASFTMQGMDMGLNRYRLLSQVNGATQTNGVWIANITLPVCTQGQSDWRMTVELQTTTTTEQYQLAFANRPATRHSNKP
ncbi:MAG: hypothetical protein ABL885_13635 [Methylophilaceae bacterium]